MKPDELSANTLPDEPQVKGHSLMEDGRWPKHNSPSQRRSPETEPFFKGEWQMIGKRMLVTCLVGVGLAGCLGSAASADNPPAKDSKAAQLYVRLLGTSA
jgi:hypothetical protein